MTDETDLLSIFNHLDPEMFLKPGFNNKINVSFARGVIEDKRPFGVTGPIKYKNSYYKHSKLDPFDTKKRTQSEDWVPISLILN